MDLVPPGVDVDRFRPGRAAHRPDIVFVGPLDDAYRWKGVDVLWDAFRRVHAERPDARLTLVGSGDRVNALRRKAEDEGLPVRFPGRLDDASLRKTYRRAATVVLPSLTEAESFGMVLAEANASGRPVVASDVGGIPDFVRDGVNGLLAPPGDAVGLAERLGRIMDDPDDADRMGRNGRAIVEAHHCWDDLAARTEAVLQRAA